MREVCLEHAEFVVPGVPEDPEVESALLLVVPAFCAESFESVYFCLDVVCLDVQVHAFLLELGIVGALQQDSDVRVG